MTITVAGLGFEGDWPGPILHACAEPCWRRAHTPLDGRQFVDLDTSDFYWKLVDPRVNAPHLLRLAEWRLAQEWLATQTADVLIHCNHGRSRAPSIELLHMARTGALPRVTYRAAWLRYDEHVASLDRPTYRPGDGIRDFLRDNWKELLA